MLTKDRDTIKTAENTSQWLPIVCLKVDSRDMVSGGKAKYGGETHCFGKSTVAKFAGKPETDEKERM